MKKTFILITLFLIFSGNTYAMWVTDPPVWYMFLFALVAGGAHLYLLFFGIALVLLSEFIFPKTSQTKHKPLTIIMRLLGIISLTWFGFLAMYSGSPNLLLLFTGLMLVLIPGLYRHYTLTVTKQLLLFFSYSLGSLFVILAGTSCGISYSYFGEFLISFSV